MFEATFFQTERQKNASAESHKTISFRHRRWTFYWFQSKWTRYIWLCFVTMIFWVLYTFYRHSAITVHNSRMHVGCAIEIRFCIILSICSRSYECHFTISVLYFFLLNSKSVENGIFKYSWNMKNRKIKNSKMQY